MGSWPDRAGVPPKYGTGRCGCSGTKQRSTRHSGRRSPRSPRRSGVPPRQPGAGSDRPRVSRATPRTDDRGAPASEAARVRESLRRANEILKRAAARISPRLSSTAGRGDWWASSTTTGTPSEGRADLRRTADRPVVVLRNCEPVSGVPETIPSPAEASRHGATATLQFDGRVVLSGGLDAQGMPATRDTVFDPDANNFASSATAGGGPVRSGAGRGLRARGGRHRRPPRRPARAPPRPLARGPVQRIGNMKAPRRRAAVAPFLVSVNPTYGAALSMGCGRLGHDALPESLRDYQPHITVPRFRLRSLGMRIGTHGHRYRAQPRDTSRESWMRRPSIGNCPQQARN
jgi:hypothetical protein